MERESIIQDERKNLNKFKQKVKPKPTIPVLIYSDVKMHLEKLHWKFVIVTIDKASDNFGFICRKYYIFKLFAEVTLNRNKNYTSTDSQTKTS